MPLRIGADRVGLYGVALLLFGALPALLGHPGDWQRFWAGGATVGTSALFNEADHLAFQAARGIGTGIWTYPPAFAWAFLPAAHLTIAVGYAINFVSVSYTHLNVLSSFLPDSERIITIEDAAELLLNQSHIVRLESRPPNVEGSGEIRIRDLFRNALRMRPDRIIIGECRGAEALDMLQAMNTGHDGSLTTIHANSQRDALSRVETMVLMAGFDLPVRAIREQIASALDIVVHTSRMRDGSRKLVGVSEVVGMESDIVTMQEIVRFSQRGVDKENKVVGEFCYTGVQPICLKRFEEYGIPYDSRTLNELSLLPSLW